MIRSSTPHLASPEPMAQIIAEMLRRSVETAPDFRCPPRFGRFGKGPTKTVESKRDVGMLPIVEQALRAHRAARELRSPWIFANRDGGPLDITNLRERVWRPALRRAKLRARTLY
jgi:hypothetical protein